MTEYMFVRPEGFYFVEVESDEVALLHVEKNPGTHMVLNMQTGRKVWESAPSATRAESSTQNMNPIGVDTCNQ